MTILLATTRGSVSLVVLESASVSQSTQGGTVRHWSRQWVQMMSQNQVNTTMIVIYCCPVCSSMEYNTIPLKK